MKRFLIGLATLAASTGYGCVAHAQCPGGVCSYPVQQASYPTPVRQAVYATAQAMTQAVAPKCLATTTTNERRQPVRDAIRKVLGGRCR